MDAAETSAEVATPASSSNTDGSASMPAGEAVARLDFLTVLRVSGADAHAYLQGQLTADVGEVAPSTSRLAAWCSPKGRVLALFRVFADPAGGYRLVCERWVAATLLARLRMFVLRSEVRIEDVGGDLEVAGVAGVRALPDRLATWAATAEVDDVVVSGEMAVARVPGHAPRFQITGAPARIESFASARAAGGVPQVEAGAWRLADILAGVPRVGARTSDTFLPQMLNLDRLRAVSFEKGCYVGQEIVARAQHLGRVKRRACVGRTTAAAAEGDPIVDAANAGAPRVGTVVCAEPHPDGGSAALLVLNVDAAHSPALRAGGTGGPALRITASPHAPEFPVAP